MSTVKFIEVDQLASQQPPEAPEEKKVVFNEQDYTNGCRGFAFTDYIMDVNFLRSLYDRKTPKMVYMVFGREVCETTGKLHFQGFMYFKSQRGIKVVMEDFKPRHVEYMYKNSSPIYNRDYCLKSPLTHKEFALRGIDHPNYGKDIVMNSTAWEWGECPRQGKRNDYVQVSKKIRDGVYKNYQDVVENDPQLAWTMRGGIQDTLKLYAPVRTEMTKLFINWGPGGSGKSHHAIAAGAATISISGEKENPFLNGYTGQEKIVINEFNYRKCDIRIFCDLIDKWPFMCNVKRDSIQFVAKEVYLTSNEHPKHWWPEATEEQFNAFWRRIEEINEFKERLNVPKHFPKENVFQTDGSKVNLLSSQLATSYPTAEQRAKPKFKECQLMDLLKN